MKPDPEVESRRWFSEAETDLGAARHLADGGFHHLSCFHCQQAVEKALKSYLLLKGAREVRGHSVSDLCEAACRFEAEFRELVADVSSLDQYYIPTRYPNGLPGGLPSRVYSGRDSERAIQTTEKAIAFIRARLW